MDMDAFSEDEQLTQEILVPLLAQLLERVLIANKHNVVRRGGNAHIPPAIQSFYAYTMPKISILDYMLRIVQFAACSPSCLILAMVYIERLVARTPFLVITRYTVHRICVTAMLLAVKFVEDLHYDNEYWARIAGISLEEINCLEADFLNLLDWNLNVRSEVYNRYLHGLVSTAAAPVELGESPASAIQNAVPSVPVRRRASLAGSVAPMPSRRKSIGILVPSVNPPVMRRGSVGEVKAAAPAMRRRSFIGDLAVARATSSVTCF